MNSPRGSKAPSPRDAVRRGWRVAAIAAAVAGVLALGACSHGPGHAWRGGWHEGAMSGPMDPERAARFAERMADRIVKAVDGSPEQRSRIVAIAQAAITDLAPLRVQAREARGKALELLRAPAVDRAAIETLRAGQVGLADAASKRIAAALADTAEVLTPEQRVRLADRMQRERGRGA